MVNLIKRRNVSFCGENIFKKGVFELKEYLKRIHGESLNEYYNSLNCSMENCKREFIVTVNPEILVNATKDEGLDKMLLDENVSLVPDGIAIVKACRMHKIEVAERMAGVDIAEYLIQEANRQKKSVYFLGAKPEVVKTLAEKVSKEYPDVKIAGFTDGYVQDKDKVFDEIVKLSPDVVLVALGVPAQERLIYKHLDRFEKGIFVGVGGSFDVLSGMKARAPEFFIKHNIEWLYRIMKEPSRLKRFYNNNVKFIYKISKEK